jgi:Putative lumazine-binding
MKKMMLLVVAAAVAGVLVWSPARAESAEEAAVRAAVGHYLRAHATGQGEHHRKVFHPEAKLFAVREGKFWQLTSEEYISRSPGKPADDEAQRKRSIESVDVTGNAAVAKVVLDYPSARLTDYMSLLKIDGEWRIVNKIFYAEQKAK